MQFLTIDNQTSLIELSNIVGTRNVDSVLALNSLTRTPNVGTQFADKCAQMIAESTGDVPVNRKVTLLNTLTSDSEIYEKACCMSETEWKIFSALNTFDSTLRIPPTLTIPSSDRVLGNNEGVSSLTYERTMNQLKTQGYIDPSIFSTYSTDAMGATAVLGSASTAGSIFSQFAIPWGEVQLYSSLSEETMDFPCYPEEVETNRAANYGTMPDTLFQYEPWYLYESSGPREQTLEFKFHRDMWTGDHTDEKAAQLIRFCEANCYPEYKGSAVNTSTVTLYVHGTAFITGIMTQVGTHWDGPIGQDGWYLNCTLSLTINEVSPVSLNYNSIRNMNVIGGYVE